MRSFHEIQNCEGYYYNVRTGEILRIVGPGAARCWSAGSWRESAAAPDPDAPEFELLTENILAPIEAVEELLRRRHPELAHRQDEAPVWNRQTAVEPDGRVITEEARLRP